MSFEIFKKFLFSNLESRQIVLKNTFWLLFGRIGGAILRAFLIIFAARVLGAQEFGSFSLAISFTLIFSVLCDFGLSPILTREVAKNENKRHQYFATTFWLIIIFALISWLLMLGLAQIFIKDLTAKIIIPILGLSVLFDVVREFFNALFRAFEKMEYQGLTHFATNLIAFVLGIIVLLLAPSAYIFAWSYLISLFLGMILTGYFLKEYFIQLFQQFNHFLVKPILFSAWPIGIASLLGLLVAFLDTIILGWFKPAIEVGWYSAGIKFYQFLILIPNSVAQVFLPRFSKTLKDLSSLRKNIELALTLSALVTFPLVGGGFVLANKIIELIYGSQYQPTALALQLLIFSLLGNAIFLPLVNLLIAFDKRRDLIVLNAIVVFFNGVLNILFIPQYGYLAASLINSLTMGLGVVILKILIANSVSFKILKNISKPLIATLIMGLFLFPIKNLSLMLSIPLGGVVYFLSLVFLKEELTKKLFFRFLKIRYI